MDKKKKAELKTMGMGGGMGGSSGNGDIKSLLGGPQLGQPQ